MKNKFKFIITFILLMGINSLLVNAEECADIKDSQTTNDRTLTCNATNSTSTKFTYPKTGTEEVYKNSLCTIKCQEEVLLSIDSSKSVLAGMGFNYRLYMGAERKCVATYDYTTFNTTLRDLVSKRNSYSKGSTDYTNYRNQISNLLQEKEDCDNYGTTEKGAIGKYDISPSITLEVETSKKIDSIPYIFKQASEYKPSTEESNASYSSCDLKDKPENNCIDTTKTVTGWTQFARIDGYYTMKDRYIKKYTGEVVEVESGDTCKAGDTYFTSFTEITRPRSDDTTDKGYSLKLIVKDLGNNLKATGDTWKLTVNCWYKLKNLIFPQGGTTGSTVVDEYYEKYGSTTFMYRTIDLNNPFPNRKANANWLGKEYLITNQNTAVRNKTRFTIYLNSSLINRVREYNDSHSYDTFNFNEMERSKFIEANPYIVTRK